MYEAGKKELKIKYMQYWDKGLQLKYKQFSIKEFKQKCKLKFKQLRMNN